MSYNENPHGSLVGDCTVRAISCALNSDWDSIYWGLCVEGANQKDMPSSNAVWGSYLRKRGWRRHAIPDDLPDDYTVADFVEDNQAGTYLLALNSHVLCVRNGTYIDTWDSGKEIPLYYWEKER